jgi:hypothetical protein
MVKRLQFVLGNQESDREAFVGTDLVDLGKR